MDGIKPFCEAKGAPARLGFPLVRMRVRLRAAGLAGQAIACIGAGVHWECRVTEWARFRSPLILVRTKLDVEQPRLGLDFH